MGKNNRSLSDRRHEIYSTWISCGQKTREAARQLGIDPSVIRKYTAMVEAEIAAGEWTAPAVPEVPIGQHIAADRDAKRARAEAASVREQYASALEQIEERDRQIAAITALQAPAKPLEIKADLSTKKGQAVAIIQATDWHVEERVDPRTVNGLNEYTPEIAERRARAFFRNSLKLVRKERQDVKIDTLILHLGGDLISGYIHEELEESNALSPIEATMFAKSLVRAGLQMLRADGEFKQIVVVCNHGNHGRTTKKIRVSTGARNSYEFLMYHALASDFAGDKGIRFQIADGYFAYVQAFDYTLRFHHGDAVKYHGGIGGVSIPLLKFLHRANTQRRADGDFIGHFHQLTPFSRVHKSAINGSLIGFNAYAMRIGASPEPPLQNFQLLDAARGFTVHAPIFVED